MHRNLGGRCRWLGEQCRTWCLHRREGSLDTLFYHSHRDLQLWIMSHCGMTSGDMKRIDVFERRRYRILRRVSWVERKMKKWVLYNIGSVLMLRKSRPTDERNMRVFDHIVRQNSIEKPNTREDGRHAPKGQACKDLVLGFKRMHNAEHGGCIPAGD